jgi:DNA-binding NarL/FixJ family response regulator
LRRGLELAARRGAKPLAEYARAELYAAGGRPRRAVVSGPESLTPSERRVAELAAEGHINRDIAQRLYVTPRTVEVSSHEHLPQARDLRAGCPLERALRSYFYHLRCRLGG